MTITLRLPCANPEFADLFKARLDEYAHMAGNRAGVDAGVDGRYVVIPWSGDSVDFVWMLAELAESGGYSEEFEVAQFAADAAKVATS